MYMAWRKFYEMRQKPDETVQEWYDRFQLQVKVVESVGGSFGRDTVLLADATPSFDDSVETGTMGTMQTAADHAKDKYLAYKFAEEHTKK